MKNEVINQFNLELDHFWKAYQKKDHEQCFHYLSRAHVLSQKSVKLHLKTHWIMFKYALYRNDQKEIRGQILRLLVTMPGHLIGKVPVGNIGWATVGLTETMPVPEDLKAIYFG